MFYCKFVTSFKKPSVDISALGSELKVLGMIGYSVMYGYYHTQCCIN